MLLLQITLTVKEIQNATGRHLSRMRVDIENLTLNDFKVFHSIRNFQMPISEL